jgi:serine/threonine protein kinase
MTLGVITCKSCGSQAREGHHFCPACANPLGVAVAPTPADPGYAAGFAYTDTWDSVLPRLQEALFGEFVISRELGRGGMAAVFLAHQIKLDRKVAIKVMAPSLMSQLGLVERFRDEATTVARLDHPSIISIYEVGAAAGLQYFIMQYVAGRSLERALKQYGRLPVNITRAIMFEVGSALAYAHRREVIHRDVKPGNILLGTNGRVMVSDFGIAKVAQSTTRTQTGAVIGTPAYMSPEQCWGKALTWSADQYALGVVAYEMLTGTQPFVGTAYAVMRGHTEERVPDVLSRRPDCPPDVALAVTRMLGKRPEDRFASMSEALHALGASRSAMDDAAQEAVGDLAVPLPDEEGLVLVHTPASPAPVRSAATTAPTPSAPEPRSPSVRDRLRDFVQVAVGRGRSGWQWLATQWSHLTTRVAATALVAVARILSISGRTRIAASLAVFGVLVAVIAVLFLNRAPRRPPATIAKTAPIDTPRAAPSEAMATIDSTNVVGGLDSLPTTPDSDSTTPVVDSTAPSTLTLTRVGPNSNLQLIVGDSVRIGATVRDLRNKIVRGADVSWKISDSAVTLRTMPGESATWVRAQVPGRATLTARLGAIQQSARFEVKARPTQIAGPSSTEKAVDSPSSKIDTSAEADAVQAAVSSFVSRDLNGGDIDRIAQLYRATTPSDTATRDSFINAIREKNTSVRPEQNPAPPSITGNRATADVVITLTVKRSLGRQKSTRMTLHADLNRRGDGWHVTVFRVSQ